MTNHTLAEPDLSALLVAVGASPNTAENLDYSMESLGLDSLARIELSSRIKDRFGVEVEDDVRPATTGLEILALVAGRLQKAGSRP